MNFGAIKVFLIFVALASAISLSLNKRPYRVLVFSKTKGFRHESIEIGKIALIQLGRQNGFEADTTENQDFFTDHSLEKYKAIIFFNTTGDVLNNDQQSALEGFIKKGGGFVGIHAAADTEYDWPWYGQLVGAYFKSHPEIQPAILRKFKEAKLTKDLPKDWKRTDEWYNFKQISPDINVLYTLDESTYTGGENGFNHPISWNHEVGKGRSFYTALGHTKESYSDPLFLNHVLSGIRYAVKDIK